MDEDFSPNILMGFKKEKKTKQGRLIARNN